MNTKIVRVYIFSCCPCDNHRYSHEMVTHFPYLLYTSPQVTTFRYISFSICASLFQKHTPQLRAPANLYFLRL